MKSSNIKKGVVFPKKGKYIPQKNNKYPEKNNNMNMYTLRNSTRKRKGEQINPYICQNKWNQK